MIILKKEWIAPSLDPLQVSLSPRKHQPEFPLRAGEMVILMDYPDAKDWYVAEISQVIHDRFTVNCYITKAIPLQGYKQASRKDRIKALKGAAFLRTWCKDKGKGEATNVPPTHLKGMEMEGYLWKWRLPVGEVNQLLLVRNVILDKEGCLCKASRTLTAALKYPQYVGAGGEESAS
jgi:hypothetical protein